MTTERELLDRVHRRYGQVYGNGRRYVVAEHVKNTAGHYTQAILDAVVLDVWPSSGLLSHGIEVKTSRGDFLREVRDLSKSAAFRPFLDYFWILAPSNTIIRADLPEGWGLLVPHGRGLTVARQSKRNLEREEMPRAMVFSLARAAAKTAERQQKGSDDA